MIMLRQVVNSSLATGRRTVLGRKDAIAGYRLFNAATSAEKRALNQRQLGVKEGTTSQPTAGPPPPPPGKGSSSSSVPLLLGGLIVVGAGVAYSQGLIPGIAPHPEEAGEQKEEALSRDESRNVKEENKENTSDATGNRVVKISLPQGSKGPPPLLVAVGHPVGGNKVDMSPTVKSQSAENAPSVDSALQELQSKLSQETSRALSEAHQELAKLSSLDISEMDKMSTTQLKIRLVQLAKDLEERTKWEAVRLKEFLAMKEKEVEDKYVLLLDFFMCSDFGGSISIYLFLFRLIVMMKKQRLEAESSMEMKLRQQAYELTSELQQAIQEKEQQLHAIVENSLKIQEQQFNEEKESFEKKSEEAISAKYEEMFGKSMAEAKQNFAQKMEQKAQQVQALAKKLSELEFALQNSKSYQAGSVQAHRMSAAALSLIDKLESSKPAGAAVAALQAVAEENAVIKSALEALPTLASTSGVATLQELQTRFEEQVHKKCRQAALVPAGQQGLEGQLLGMFFSTLKFPPGPEDAAPESEKDVADFVLARARRHVQLGELEQAVMQMEKLNGQAAFVAKDWTRKAKDRVSVEKALKVIRLECALANESMSNVSKK